MAVALLNLTKQYRSIKREIDQAIKDVVESQQFVLGPQVDQLEKSVAAYSGCAYAIGVSSGTDALLATLMAWDIGSGDEVITTPYTFFATAGCIARTGAKPVFVDIDPVTYNINPAMITKKITKRTKAIVPVHLYGQCADMEQINRIARKHKLHVIEDCAQAIGAGHPQGKAGSMGTAGIISFFPTKNLGAFGDAGMVVTNRKSLATKIYKLRVHGGGSTYIHDYVGGNFRIDAIQAAVLNVKMKYVNRWTRARQRNASIYDRLFRDLVSSGNVQIPKTSEGNMHVYNQYVIRVRRRDSLRAFLENRDIGTGIYYPKPLHLQRCFRSLQYKMGDFPESERASRETLALPIYPELTPNNLNEVAQAIASFYH